MAIDKTILYQWERYHSDGSSRTLMDKLIRQSWERSIAAGIDKECTPPQLTKEEMEQIKRDTKKLYIYTNSILRPLLARSPYPSLGGMLFSPGGVLLHIFGTNEFHSWAAENHLKEGTRWTESAIGTSIFSVGIKRGSGAKLIGAQNFLRFLVGGAYYFSPITQGDGELLGGLALAVPYEDRGDYLQTFAKMAARIIELQFFWFDIVEDYGDSSDGQGLIALDQSSGQNHVLVMGKEIFKMLRTPPRNCYYDTLESIIDPLPHNADFWETVNQNIRVIDKPFEIYVDGKPNLVSISISTFQEERFHMKGLVILFNSFQRINRLVTKYSNNPPRYHFSDIIGNSSACVDTVERSKIAALSDSNILLLGESGVGKDIVAQSIHNESRRNGGPFVAINCAAFSKELIASELFGYESGAFTGAKKGGSIGKFELANNGTLFLDEIGDMPLNLQALLLRVIEERSFMKVGGTTTIRVNVRIIAATNINLTEQIKQGMFREDLFYRLGIVRIQIPPLRRRGEDVLLLASHFIPLICLRLNKPIVTLSKEAEQFLLKYRWPGNIRELQNLLEGIICTHNETIISVESVRQYLGHLENDQQQASLESSTEPGIYDERAELLDALRVCRNNRTKAAKYLGISRRTLYRLLDKYNLT